MPSYGLIILIIKCDQPNLIIFKNCDSGRAVQCRADVSQKRSLERDSSHYRPVMGEAVSLLMTNVQIIDYAPCLQQHFYAINKEWISQMFVMEDIDEKVLQNPEQYIIQAGGHIWFAQHPELGIVGACALRKATGTDFELTKMGVLKKARGLKVGERLLQHVIDYVRANKWDCYLLTNGRCEAAIHLYLKNGFVHDKTVKESFGLQYERCNVAMRLSSESLVQNGQIQSV